MKQVKLSTRRLVLRMPETRDIESLIANINNINVARYLSKVPHPYTKKDARWFISNCAKKARKKPRTDYNFGIELKQEGRVIGGIGIHDINTENGSCEIGYWLGEKYWRQGITYEAAQRVIGFAFRDLKMRRVEVKAFVENDASNGLIKKLGFSYEGTQRKAVKAKSTGKFHDVNIYAMLREDWMRRK